jgi:tRNA wybutosine-synthesizing protein 2
MITTPFETIQNLLAKIIPKDLVAKIPDKWEKVGNVIIIKLPSELKKYYSEIGNVYADILDCKTVLNDAGGITGEFREPNVKIIYGSKNTVTIHKENRVKYKLDPQKIMFSSGNMDERIRIATISNKKETIVDLFAGIGYFSLPIAVHSKPKKVFACEKNSISFDFLIQNITLNKVNDIVEPLEGDNRKIAPENVADRVLLGYFGKTHEFLPIALNCLKNNCGIVHYHDKFPEDVIPDKPLEFVKNVAEKYKKNVELLQYKHVKTYAPGISHYVFDIKIGEK